VETNQALSNSNKGASNPILNQSKLSTEETAGKQTKTVGFVSQLPVENEPTTVQMTNTVDLDVRGQPWAAAVDSANVETLQVHQERDI